jgi:tRNA(Ile)-lysidine synthase
MPKSETRIPSNVPSHLSLDERLLQPGQRIAVAVSGGADSIALLRTLLARNAPGKGALGVVLSVAHVHHGIRGPEHENAADVDQAFVEALAKEHDLAIHLHRVDTPAYAAEHGQTLEEAARNLRYAFFHDLLAQGHADAVATAHTLDDQAETVLHKFLRGAWTEGLGGISPAVAANPGRIIRPLLSVPRTEIEAYLTALGQPWCEDATNRDLAHTRNRLRHHLLPILAGYNPQLPTQLSRLAAIARDEQAWWQREVARIGSGLLLPGKPVRGGGRASSTHPGEATIALELERLRSLEPALRRRVLRWAAAQVQANLDFNHTEQLMHMCNAGNTLKNIQLSAEVCVRRTARELQFSRAGKIRPPQTTEATELAIPGTVAMEFAGWTFQAISESAPGTIPPAIIRRVRPGDRVTLRHSRGPKKAKEIFERMRVASAERQSRLVVVWEGRIVWMEGVELEPESLGGLPFRLEGTRPAS